MGRLFMPFDVTTAAGRGRERYRRIALAAGAAMAQRLIGVLATVIVVRVTLEYLGAERYGVFVTMTAIVALFGFADFGIGNGLVNAISQANGRDDVELARVYVSSAGWLLTVVALVFGAVFALAYGWIPWAAIFNASSPAVIADVGPAAAVFVGCFLVALPLGVVQRIQLGYQEGFANSLWLAAGTVIGLVGIVLAVSLEAGLPWLALATAGAPALALGLNGLVLFGFRRPWLRPRLGLVRRKAVRRIATLGSYFFVIQFAIAVGWGSDTIVIAQVLGPEEVPEYAIPFRLFMFVPLLLNFVLIPLWPAFGEAIERGDVQWVRTTFRRSLALAAFVNVLAAAVLVAVGDMLIHAWVGSAIDPTDELLLGLALWMVLTGIGGPMASLLNGAGLVRFEALCATLMVLVNLPLSIVLAHTIGVSGVVFATVIAMVVCVYLPAAIFISVWFRRLTRFGSTVPR